MKQPEPSFNNFIEKIYPDKDKAVRNITFQVTDSCNLRCTYCYQHNKGNHIMTFETAKTFFDLLLNNSNIYINSENTYGIIVEFIGGEPFLAVDLIDQITEYVLNKMIEEKHPWLLKTRFSISTNGTLYFEEKVQNYIKKYKDFLSLGISLDGNKELHDACRVFPDNSGSYDIVVASVKDFYLKNKKMPGSKMTFAPSNINYVYSALKNLIDLDYKDIYANCVFEEGWDYSHATILYNEMKKLSNYVLENNLDDKLYISLYEEKFFKESDPNNDKNWCGGNGQMIALNYKGDIYPCLRYMESSLGKNIEPIIIGDLQNGIAYNEDQQKIIKELQSITKSSQSTQECMECKIAEGCAWCSAYNYEYYGCLNKRATFICPMHKARALANIYYWNLYYKKNNINKVFKCNLPEEESLKIISKEEYDYLISLTKF